MATVYIDNQPFEVNDKHNMLQAALSVGLNLPYFCWHPAMGSVGACRQCAVKQFRDEKDTRGKLVMACMTPAKNGTRISIQDPEARAFRASIIEWLMLNHPHDCPVCDEGGECHLQDMTVMTGHDYRRYRGDKRTFRNQYLGPFVNHEMNRCIQCYRCVRYYRDYSDGRDFNAFVLRNLVFFGRQTDGVLENEFSGNLVEVCPTGVFTDATLKHHYTRKWDLQNAPSVCVNCSIGCNTVPGERYGVLRRLRARYNGQVNSYFLCDRGRYGYEFVNSSRRIRYAIVQDRARPAPAAQLEDVAKLEDEFSKTGAGFAGPSFDEPKSALTKADVGLPAQPPNRAQVMDRVRSIVSTGGRVIGIGSPRASLESNFALSALVGPERFYSGMSATDLRLVLQIIDILEKGPARSPSLKEIESCDAVLVLGEDVTNYAPMQALALRQSVRVKPIEEIARKLSIPDWDDKAVREAIQEQKGPCFIATPSQTKLEDIATQVYHGAPDDIARLGLAVAHALDAQAPGVGALAKDLGELVTLVAEALKGAKRPLILAGTGCQSEAVVQAAANVAWALCGLGLPAQLAYTMPEANSLGVALMETKSIEDAFQSVREGGVDTAIILENDLYRRAGPAAVDRFLESCKHVVAIDSLVNPTAEKAEIVLPAATFAEADGTFVNQEGRAQRFYQVFVPIGDIQESWRWVRDIAAASGRPASVPWERLDDLGASVAGAVPLFKPILEIAPPASFRIAGMKIAREPNRFSGRTAMYAHISVNEPKPADDPDSPLAFSMEGFQGEPPPALIPRFWAPGWNSPQAVNKFQIEVPGPLRGGDPGKRLLEPAQSAGPAYFDKIPESFKRQEGRWLTVPLYHIFGSEELSMLTPGIAELAPAPYVALGPEDASRLGASEGDMAELALSDRKFTLAVKISQALPAGLVGLPVGLPSLQGIGMSASVQLRIEQKAS